MRVQTFIMVEFTSPVDPARLLKGLAIEYHKYMPKVVPHYVKSIEVVEGDSCNVGCIFKLNFPKGNPWKYVKNRTDEIDLNNFYVKYTCIEGDVLGDKLKCVVFEHKSEALGSGCHYKIVAHYYSEGDYVMKEDEVAIHKKKFKMNSKAMEEYLMANPHVCV